MHIIIVSISWNYFFQVKICNLFPSLFPHGVSVAKTEKPPDNWKQPVIQNSPPQGLPLPCLLPLATRNTNGSMLINASATQTRLKSTTTTTSHGNWNQWRHWGSIPWNSHGAFGGQYAFTKLDFRRWQERPFQELWELHKLFLGVHHFVMEFVIP